MVGDTDDIVTVELTKRERNMILKCNLRDGIRCASETVGLEKPPPFLALFPMHDASLFLVAVHFKIAGTHCCIRRRQRPPSPTAYTMYESEKRKSTVRQTPPSPLPSSPIQYACIQFCLCGGYFCCIFNISQKLFAFNEATCMASSHQPTMKTFTFCRYQRTPVTCTQTNMWIRLLLLHMWEI